MIALAVTAAVLADLCAPPAPRLARDPAAAARYLAVGDAERAAGHVRTAAIAYRAALAREPDSAVAREALRAVCDGEAPAASEDQLTAGIARYRAGDYGEARRHLTEAARGEGAAAAGAHFFLGVIAFRAGARAEAVRELSLAQADPSYAEPAAELRRLARRQGRLSLSVLVASEWDSNVGLVPDTPPTALAGEPLSDGGLLAALALAWRPVGAVTASGSVAWRKHLRLDELDLLAARGELALELAPGRHRLGLRADAGADVLGGVLYGSSQRGALSYAWEPAPGSSAGARYALRRRELGEVEAEPLSGWVHAAALAGGLRLTHALRVGAEVEGARELTRDPLYDAWSVTGSLEARLALGAGLRLTAAGGLGGAWFDAGRRDLRLTAGLDAEVDLHDHLALVAGVDLEREESTDETFELGKVVVRAGLAGYLGLP